MTCTDASLAFNRIRQARAGPAGRAGIPAAATRPSTILPSRALVNSAAMAVLAASVPFDLEEQPARLTFGRVVEMIHEILSQGDLVSIAHARDNWAIVFQSRSAATRHITSCESDVGALAVASFLSAF